MALALEKGKPFAQAMQENASIALAEKIGGALTPFAKVLSSQPGFDLTPKMREGALGGLPLFSRPAGETPFGQMPRLFGKPGVLITDVRQPLFKSPAQAYTRLKRGLAGKTFTNADTGLPINVSGNALRHSIFNRFTPESGAAHTELGQLLERAVLGETHAPTKPGDQHSLKAVYRFYAAMDAPGREGVIA